MMRADADQLKRDLGSTEVSVSRPRLRTTIRPLSPVKLSLRPKSACDLRNTPSPRPASEVRRPALHLKTSSRSIAYDQAATEATDSNTVIGADEQQAGVTPGQRMAERFLKERKSATVLERGMRKSTGKFVRQDTPAFL